MIKIIEENFDSNKWNALANHPLQSWQWGEARKKLGIEVLRLQDNKNVFQLTVHKLPYTRFKIGYLPRSVIPSQKILDFFTNYGKKNRLVFIKIEPYETISNLKTQISKPQLKSQNLIKSSHPLFPNWTQLLDLTPTEEELLKKMHHKTRYNIKLAQKKGVTIKEMSNTEGFEIFQKLYFETTKRQKYFGHNYDYHKTIWENLKDKISHILIAYYENKPLAAYQMFLFKNTWYYVYGGTSELHRNLMASNLLMWEAIKLGKKLGAKKLDMWGSLPPGYDHSDPWAGFTRFKEGYGGKFVEFIGNYDLIINQTIYKFYNISFILRNVLLKIKNSFT